MIGQVEWAQDVTSASHSVYARRGPGELLKTGRAKIQVAPVGSVARLKKMGRSRRRASITSYLSTAAPRRN